jgi:hypothetical protein
MSGLGCIPACFTDITGRVFGRLKVIRRAPNNPGCRYSRWECVCSCGGTTISNGSSLRMGHTKSCGCIQREYAKTGDAKRIHGMTTKGTPERRLYDIWSKMKNRCENPSYRFYKNYGGRGIKVCEEWHDNRKFFAWALANGYRHDLCIEREDNDGNYEPSNCCWATYKEQGRNKRNNVMLEMDGVRQSLSAWAEEVGIEYSTLRHRICVGWEFIDALTIPVLRYA